MVIDHNGARPTPIPVFMTDDFGNELYIIPLASPPADYYCIEAREVHIDTWLRLLDMGIREFE